MVTMKTAVLAAIAAMAALALPAAASAADGKAAPTFAKDVAPIFYKSCVECHRPTMFAPMSLVTYDEARPWARSIKQRVVARAMPPWGADAPRGLFKNDPSLTDEEIDTIARWVDGGAPRGDDTDLPATPQFAEGWTIGKPDVVFTMEEEFQIPAEGAIPYQYLRVPTHLTDDKWIQALEIRPGASAQVHHVIAFTQPAGSPINGNGVLGPTNIGGTTPNKPGIRYPEGVGRLLRGNSDIILQIHYTTNGKATTDRTRVGIIYAAQPPAKLAAGGMVLQPRFVIPAYDGNAEVKGTTKLQRDTLVTTLTPHMHVRGKDMTYIAHYADGTSETLLAVPKYDFNWQITYELAKPKVLPKGTEVEVIAHYDNSPTNKFNPDPSKDVRWGDQTWEEMMIGFFGVVVDRPVVATQPQP
ncbi:MAG: thiol-disulfide isomerase [Acidobacteria bacterium]|nr:MAG: thiol-disulfide isomerase [Acidobacteriota bacterium]